MKTFGEKLLDLRKESKMTQEELADNLGVTRQTVSNWELNQTKPDLDQLKGLSKVYKISLDELVDNNVKELLTERVSNVEKLAGLTYKILKFILFLFIGGVILVIAGIVLFSANTSSSVTIVEDEVTLHCSLNDENYTIQIKSDGDNKIIELNGSEELINILDLEKNMNSNQVLNKVTSYIEDNGGSCY